MHLWRRHSAACRHDESLTATTMQMVLTGSRAVVAHPEGQGVGHVHDACSRSSDDSDRGAG